MQKLQLAASGGAHAVQRPDLDVGSEAAQRSCTLQTTGLPFSRAGTPAVHAVQAWLVTCRFHDVALPFRYRECLEVKCRSASIPVDGEWDKLDRKGVCLNDKIVKVKITDTCAILSASSLFSRMVTAPKWVLR